MSVHCSLVLSALRCPRLDIYTRLKQLQRFSTSTWVGTEKKGDIHGETATKSVQGPVVDDADIKLGPDTTERTAFSESLQQVRRPTNLDKLCLLWAGKYKTRDDIPEFVRMKQIAFAQDYTRTVVMIWLMVTFTIGFYTIGRFGQRKLQILYDDVEKKQNEIWVRKNKIADEEYALKKQKEREEREAQAAKSS